MARLRSPTTACVRFDDEFRRPLTLRSFKGFLSNLHSHSRAALCCILLQFFRRRSKKKQLKLSLCVSLNQRLCTNKAHEIPLCSRPFAGERGSVVSTQEPESAIILLRFVFSPSVSRRSGLSSLSLLRSRSASPVRCTYCLLAMPFTGGSASAEKRFVTKGKTALLVLINFNMGDCHRHRKIIVCSTTRFFPRRGPLRVRPARSSCTC